MSKVNTVTIVDPRIEPQPTPTYAKTISPKQSQFYKIPASGLSNSMITFNNLTTLGPDRAYADSFEIELTASFTLHFVNGGSVTNTGNIKDITFDSFPFNKCCEEIRVNINGGAFFSQPLSSLPAHERYWDDKKIIAAYGNVCPCNKPWVQNEGGYDNQLTPESASLNEDYRRGPFRLGLDNHGYTSFATGPNGCSNSDIIPVIPFQTSVAGSGEADLTFSCTWREPIFCSPFSTRVDENYGKPLYNITSLDLTFNMQDLRSMIRATPKLLQSISVNITSAELCYNVLTIPKEIPAPPMTQTPYRRFVSYITDSTETSPYTPSTAETPSKIRLTSGVYTLNEVPTAIWIMAGPRKNLRQQGYPDSWGNETDTQVWSYNKLFLNLDHVSISCANTTQILNTATPYDLYRIAKANGCQDSYSSWARHYILRRCKDSGGAVNHYMGGVGSVLRLIPGTDIVLPEQDLTPGSNANNMVFQVTADFVLPIGIPRFYRYFSLWVIFEYVGVATISPGQCTIDMAPLAKSIPAGPVVSETATAEPSTVEGSGWLDKIKGWFGKANDFAKKTGIIGKALSYVPNVGSTLSAAAKSMGYGYKRPPPRLTGGAVMGMGDFC